METGDQSAAAMPPDALDGQPDPAGRDATSPRSTRRRKLSDAVSTLVAAVTDGGGGSIA